MTLVVSEVSGLGIVMVGDSAVTFHEGGHPKVRSGVAKIQYSDQANIGFAMWGRACVGTVPMDRWLSAFIADQTAAGDRLADVASRLADSLNADLSALGPVAWNKQRRGIHVAGYVEGLPHLYHVHTGGDANASHELRVFPDFPFGAQISLADYRDRLENVGGYHLRNGFYEVFGSLFDATYAFTSQLPQWGFQWPNRSLNDRGSLYRLLVQLVSDVLVAEGRLPQVGGPLSSIGFSPVGIQFDARLPVLNHVFPCGALAEF